ncbi:GNAT family N-acetyltransferase [Corallincola platygyrae]|uniref:GNAT family N-acetyltransferase n=1 Tax=Corallincola platygyrae TaxID=1193278 RepID=A0ABW4XL10_9GAMM
MNKSIQLRNGEVVCLRLLSADDGESLGRYFDALGEETRRRFGPHPLNAEYARELVSRSQDSAKRLVVSNASGEVKGYFILECEHFPHECERFSAQGIELTPGRDVSFAPSVADDMQSQGLASAVMPLVIEYVKSLGASSLVLMGGVQATNERAVGFYRKFGFEPFGGYQTDVFNQDMRLCIL